MCDESNIVTVTGCVSALEISSSKAKYFVFGCKITLVNLETTECAHVVVDRADNQQKNE
jgi:hypothetical protein